MNVALLVKAGDVAELCTLVLEDGGHAVERLDPGSSALLSARADVIVIGLGHEDCTPVIDRVRALADIPVVVISSRSRIADELDASEHGADVFLRDPFSPVSFGDAVDRLVAMSPKELTARRAKLVDRLRRLDAQLSAVRGARRLNAGLESLTPAERRVAALVADGVPLDYASASLGIARSTFLSHKGAIRRKLAVRRGESLGSFLREHMEMMRKTS